MRTFGLSLLALGALVFNAVALPSSSPFLGVDLILQRYGISARSPKVYANDLPELRRGFGATDKNPPSSSKLIAKPEYRARTPFDKASIALALHQGAYPSYSHETWF